MLLYWRRIRILFEQVKKNTWSVNVPLLVDTLFGMCIIITQNNVTGLWTGHMSLKLNLFFNLLRMRFIECSSSKKKTKCSKYKRMRIYKFTDPADALLTYDIRRC